MERETRELLSECRDAMNEATRRYRISFNLPGDSKGVAGWVEWLDRMQNRIYEHIVARDEGNPVSWRPIDTAPKDRNIIVTGRYANGRAYVEECCWHYKGHWTSRRFEPPTHWMPMPEPFGGWDAPLTEVE